MIKVADAIDYIVPSLRRERFTRLDVLLDESFEFHNLEHSFRAASFLFYDGDSLVPPISIRLGSAAA